jgi:hypothetical protein
VVWAAAARSAFRVSLSAGEMLQKGRFDELFFFVDFPHAEGRPPGRAPAGASRDRVRGLPKDG